jgi:hypothetical protein
MPAVSMTAGYRRAPERTDRAARSFSPHGPTGPAFPRFRYDQLMNLGWKRLIPLGMAAVLINAVVGMVKGG